MDPLKLFRFFLWRMALWGLALGAGLGAIYGATVVTLVPLIAGLLDGDGLGYEGGAPFVAVLGVLFGGAIGAWAP